MHSSKDQEIPIVVPEIKGISRRNEPVTVGIPLKKGMAHDSDTFQLLSVDGNCIPVQTLPLAHYKDGSIKWILLDFQVSIEAGKERHYFLRCGRGFPKPEHGKRISIRHQAGEIVIDTGNATFFLNTNVFKPFNQVLSNGQKLLADDGTKTCVMPDVGLEQFPLVDTIVVEREGWIRSTIHCRGRISCGEKNAPLQFESRLSFFQNLSVVEIQFTLHNRKAATHPGGLWDLGDEGSEYFRDLSIYLPLRDTQDVTVRWITTPCGKWKESFKANVEVYQDSSGGENWKSLNHVNRDGQVMHSFQGYQVREEGGIVEQGKRASPLVSIAGFQSEIIGGIQGFWQNFPKSLEVKDHSLIARMFPQQYQDVFELQGGEQKTHTLFFQFKQGKELRGDDDRINWIHHRLIPRATPSWYSDTKVFPYVVPEEKVSFQDDLACTMIEAEELVQSAIRGPNSFFDRREIIDEFGWRNFGDLYADHEAIGSKGTKPLVAHYNNQYDVIFGAIIQYVRSGDARWYELSQDLARHVIDIDMYHTCEDRAAYNGGLFWHTDHYCHAQTATHRTFSKKNADGRSIHHYGGGPSNEQNYTTGLLHYYYLTGDPMASDAVKQLANWIIQADDGRSRMGSWFDRRPTGQASSTANRSYHGPGRGAANSINSVMDACTLTEDLTYEAKAEELIKRCIHPKDCIKTHGLEDIEYRWSYTIFLQILGKYLDWKVERGETDEKMFHYARASLLHYAQWMVEHEVPYMNVLSKVDIPTETWPAQDIRKSNVFKYAAKYGDKGYRETFLHKSEFFLRECINGLKLFESRTLTRPIVILLTNLYMHHYFRENPNEEFSLLRHDFDFGSPQNFRSQFYELYRFREIVFTLRKMIRRSSQK